MIVFEFFNPYRTIKRQFYYQFIFKHPLNENGQRTDSNPIFNEQVKSKFIVNFK
jgi:hypothetical protein